MRSSTSGGRYASTQSCVESSSRKVLICSRCSSAPFSLHEPYRSGFLNKIKLIYHPEARSYISIDVHFEPVYQILALAACYGERASKQEVLSFSLDALARLTPRPLAETTLELLEPLASAVSHSLYTLDDTQTLAAEWLLIAIDASMELLSTPRPPHDLILHSFAVIVSAAGRCPWESMKDKTHALDLLAALLCSENVSLRALAVRTFVGPIRFEENGPTAKAPMPIRPERLPPALRRVIEDYGPDKCHTTGIMSCGRQVLESICGVRRHRDFCKFGIEMVAFLSEHGRHLDDVLDGAGYWEVSDTPYVRYVATALSVAVKTLRARGDAPAADILHLEHLYLSAPEEAAKYAEVVLGRDPLNTWAHLVLFDGATRSSAELIRLGGVALNLPLLPLAARLRIRANLVTRLVQKAFVFILNASPSEEHKRAVGLECLQDALELANVFVSEAPPDMPSLLTVLDHHILATLTLREEKYGKGLKDIQVRPCASSIV